MTVWYHPELDEIILFDTIIQTSCRGWITPLLGNIFGLQTRSLESLGFRRIGVL